MIYAKLIRAHAKHAETVTLPSRLVEQLDRMHKLVGGRVDAIDLGGSRVMWVNRYGAAAGLPVNPLATREAAHKLSHGGYIRGDVLITGWDGVGEVTGIAHQ